MKSLAALALSTVLLGSAAHAATLVLDPTSDGSLYVCDGCNVVADDAYVLASGYIQGAIKFSAAGIRRPVTQAFLTLNPYGLPLWSQEVSIYGYGTSLGQLDASDADAGTLIGVFTLPDNLGYGQDAWFDVTSFVSNTAAPFLAFNIRTTDTDVFSSLEYNLGHPSQLHVMTIPEPPVWALLMLGGVFVARRARHTR